MLHKQSVLEHLDLRAFYKEAIPSLTGESQASGNCPFHDDKRASHSVNFITGLFNCHGCGKKGDVFTFYQELKGVDFKTALKELAGRAGVTEGGGKLEKAIYSYRNKEGKELYQVVRYEPKDFRPRYRSSDGCWINNLQGVVRVPYNLPELASTSEAIIVEGEKDADNLKALGYAESTAAITTSHGGAKGWKPEYAEYFLSKQVAIIPDNDRPGLDYAETVARSLHGKANVIKIVELPGLGERKEKHGKDVSDWIELRRKEGRTDKEIMEEITMLIKEAPAWELKAEDSASRLHDSIYAREADKPRISTLVDILNYQNPEYLVEPILYQNTSNLLTAYAGVGKSLLAQSIAHAVLTGLPLWGHFQVHKTGSVLIIDEENPGAFLKDRLVKMGFKEGMPIYFLHYQGIKIDDSACFAYLVDVLNKIKPVLVIFDALIRIHNAKSENDTSEMAYVMGKMRELVNRTGITALTIHHDNKGSADGKRRARGASDIVGAVDNQICLEPKDDDTLKLFPGKTRVAPFQPIKLRLEGEGDTLSFTCLGREAGEAEEVLNEIMDILKGASLGVEDIRQGLEIKGYQIGINKLRSILKRVTGRELTVDMGLNRKQVYSINTGFTASRDIYTTLNRETENAEENPFNGFTEEPPLNREADLREHVIVLEVLDE